MKKKFSLFFLAITTMFFTFASPYIEYEVIREAELTQNPIPHYRVIKRGQRRAGGGTESYSGLLREMS